jgi:hypothetical protein
MNCPKCGTPAAAAGATHCRRCGAAYSTKTPAAASSEEIDLMPLQESKLPAHSSFEPPPGLLQPPPPPGAKAAPADPKDGPPMPDFSHKVRGAGSAPRKSSAPLLIGGVVALIVVGFLAWRIFRTENKVVSGKTKMDTTLTIQPNRPYIENLEISGKVSYALEVSPLDGELLVGMAQRAPKDPNTIAALKKLPDPIDPVRKGDSKQLGAELKAGQYSWILINESKKAVKAKVKFSTTTP